MWNNFKKFIDQPVSHHSCPAVWPCTLCSSRSVTEPAQNPGVDLAATGTGWRWKAQSDLKVERIDSGIYSELWLFWCPGSWVLLSSQEQHKSWGKDSHSWIANALTNLVLKFWCNLSFSKHPGQRLLGCCRGRRGHLSAAVTMQALLQVTQSPSMQELQPNLLW